jgi:hypothetical protein
MQEATTTIDNPCRPIRADEVEFYKKNGWVKLERFVRPAAVATLLKIARERMGDDGDSNPINKMSTNYFNSEPGFGPRDPMMKPLMDEIAKAAKALMARKTGVGVRYFADAFAAKLPADKKTVHSGNGDTTYHHDFTSFGLDRSGGMTFWLALADLTPDMGTMSFVSGSHRMGAMGYYATFGKGGLLEVFPEILDECTLTEPLAYSAGDVTVHSALCVHGAGINRTNIPRWAYLVIVNPADARWNGARPFGPNYDTTGFRLFEELPDDRFPVIG